MSFKVSKKLNNINSKPGTILNNGDLKVSITIIKAIKVIIITNKYDSNLLNVNFFLIGPPIAKACEIRLSSEYVVSIFPVKNGVGLFVVGFDQGHIFSIVMGEAAFDEMFIHELTHDLRHAAGFPCH